MPVKRYSMTGLVVSVQPQPGTARVHNDDMPGFMRAMEMDYQMTDKHALATLKPGDRIKATLVSDGQNVWKLENVTAAAPK